MSETSPQDTLNTNASELRLNRFKTVWLSWRVGEPMPRWQEHLPANEEPCDYSLIFSLLRLDIEFRVKAGLPALLAEPYFEHPRLQREDACLGNERQVELIHWEYFQRLQHGGQPQRAEYAAAFPRHVEALREMRRRSRCPNCRKIFVVEETSQTLICPDCGSESHWSGTLPPFVAEGQPAADALTEFDLRSYQLSEQLGKGGMGEVYRSSDPALGRDLAVKVIKGVYRRDAEIERRFLREARITGSLQHPGIVPVHNLGRLSDGRLHYTMRLVRGRTFADILKEETGRLGRLPYLLGIFEKICQAVAYAHSKRVIHRDLKPSNVMAGKFGEVQVMDWGLAKLLTTHEDKAPAESPDKAGTVIQTESADTPLDVTRRGSGMGTPGYMPPEQALGEWDTVDERADVFALGAILCEILTGKPAYTGRDEEEVLRRARRGELAEALGRIGQCGADAALATLCRECLAPQREHRPRNAGVLTERLAEYQAEVQERLRQAELERVAAETRAREELARAVVEQERAREALARVAAERRARQRSLALAGAVLVLLIVGVAGAWRWQQEWATAQARQDRADREALAALERTCVLLDEGWRSHDLPKLREGKAEADRAADIARGGGSAAVEQRVAACRMEAQERLERAEKNRDLLAALMDISKPPETKRYTETIGPMMLVVAEPSVEEQFAAAFRRRWPDVDIDQEAESAVAARLQEEPEVVLQGVVAGLDAWMVERRRQKRPEAEWRRLLGLVERLDPSEQRRQLRALLIGAVPPRVEDVVGLLGGVPPWSGLWELEQGNTWRRTRQLRSQINAAAESVLTVLLLAQASSGVGDLAGAEEVLRQALARRPDEVALLTGLGKVLERQDRLVESVGCYRAARARNPGLGVALARALRQAGQAVEGEAVLRDLLRQQPKNPEILFFLGNTLSVLERRAEAETAYSKAIASNPDYLVAYINLSAALNGQGKYAEAEAACRKAVALKSDSSEAYINLGAALYGQAKYTEAEAAWRNAIAIKPVSAEAYNNLGAVLSGRGNHAEAETAFRRAIALKPDVASQYSNLGIFLRGRGRYAEAEAVYRKAVALNSNYAEGYNSLGNCLDARGRHAEAETAYRRAIALKPDNAVAHYNLGRILHVRGKHAQAEAACRRAVVLNPNYAEAYVSLGNCLDEQGRHAEAEAAYRKAIALNPNYFGSHFNLGLLLYGRGRHAEAEVAYRKAIALNPDYAEAYNNLGVCLKNQGKDAEAEAAYRKAIALKPNYAGAYNNLGSALYRQGKHAEAERAWRKAIALKPDDAEAHSKLGSALYRQGKHAEAELVWRKAIELKPNSAEMYNNLGSALSVQGKHAEAEAVYRKAIALKPDDVVAYSNFGSALYGQAKHVEAEAAYRKVIALKPDYAEAHYHLGNILKSQGRFAESLAAYRRSHELGSRQPGWRYASLQWVRTAEHLVELEKRLPAILQGEASPDNGGDAVILASMCRQHKKRHAAAARLYAGAFAAEPKRGADLDQPHRYDAACSAALAAAGQGEDASMLPDKVVAMFRRWALSWLREDLRAIAQLAEQNNPAVKEVIQKRLAHWRRDLDLASVRDRPALDSFSEDERAAWQALWRDVEDLVRRTVSK